MSNETQTSVIRFDVDYANEDQAPTVISVNDVSMVFNMASQQLNSLKEYFIALLRRELMFKEFRALNDISFKVKKGDVFGILGTNGSGKSTLLKIISGVLTPTEGSVEVIGKIAPLIEMTAGFDMELTGRENIYLNGSLLGHSRKYIDEHFDDIVDFAEIDGFLDMPVKNYSSGMISRIAFSIATVMIPDILIVDEVLSVGDFMFQAKCEARIQDLIHNHGVTVLIVSHSIEQIERLCNRAIWIEKSHPRMIGDAKDVAQVYKMLGGHRGTAESERLVLDMLNSSIDHDDVRQKVIAGASRYDTAVEILEQCTFRDPKTVIVADSDNTLDRVIALGFAGALGAPVVSVSREEVPLSVRKAFRKMQPSRLVVLNSGSTLTSDVMRALQKINEDGEAPEVVELMAPDPSVLSDTVIGYAQAHGISVDTYAANREDEFELVLASPIFYRHGVVVDLEEPVESMSNELPSIKERWSSNNVHGNGAKARYSSLSELESLFSDLIWTKRTSGETDELEHVFVTSRDPSDSLSAAMYIAQNEANMVLLNHRDLDNFADVIRLLSACPCRIDKLTFIGDEHCFTSADKEVIAKAACSKRS